MAFCTQCGTQVGDRDTFCAKCGSRQAAPGPQPKPPAFDVKGIEPRTAALLCYIPIVGWIASIFVLASARFRNDMETKFHAFQGLYLFVAWLVVDWVIRPMTRFSGHSSVFNLARLLELCIMGCWIFMLVKVAQRETFKLPVLGEWAEKSVAEQR